MSTLYYIHYDDFDCDDVPENVMPKDIKRIVSHGKHTFHKRIFFFSPSQRQVYRYCTHDRLVETVKGHTVGNSLRFNLVPDTTRHDTLCVNDRMLDITRDMNKIELPNMCGYR